MRVGRYPVGMDVKQLMDLASGYWASAALTAALQLGVFERLPGSSDDLARDLGAAPDHLAQLLDALCGLQILEKSESGYDVPEALRPFLSPDSPVSLLDALRFNADLYPLWGQLAEGVRSGAPVVPPEAHLGGDPDRTRRFVRGMASRARVLAPAVARAVDLEGRTRLLDVAAGPGLFGAALAARFPDLSVTLFDLPPVLDEARNLLAGHPAAERLAFHPGDYHQDLLPSGFDAVFYCGALHQESEDAARTLFGHIHEALEPGGRLVVVDLLLEADRSQPAFSALFSLNMMLTRPHGHVYTAQRAAELLEAAGFRAEPLRMIPQTPYGLIAAVRT